MVVVAPPPSAAPAETAAAEIAEVADVAVDAAERAVRLAEGQAAEVIIENQEDMAWLRNQVRELTTRADGLQMEVNNLRSSTPQASEVVAIAETAAVETVAAILAPEPETTPEPIALESDGTPISIQPLPESEPMELGAPGAEVVETAQPEAVVVVAAPKRKRIIL